MLNKPDLQQIQILNVLQFGQDDYVFDINIKYVIIRLAPLQYIQVRKYLLLPYRPLYRSLY
jgi:hypothetical protein